MMRTRRVLVVSGAVLFFVFGVACEEGSSACPEGDCSDAPPDDSATSGGDASTGDDDDDPDGTDPSDGTDTSDDSTGDRGLPCEIEVLIDQHCTGCHDQMPIYGAPMSLVHVDDWRVPAVSDPAHTVAAMAAMRIVSDDAPMPAGDPLPAADLAILQAWIADGMPSSDEACHDDPPDEDPDPPDPADLPCEPAFTFTAHAGDEPFHVPADGSPNYYQCFTFASPVAPAAQATAWAPVIDDERVLHHWLLFRTYTSQVDGGSGPCDMPADATIVAGWAPGGGDFELPDNVGLELGGEGVSFILQIHYHNGGQYTDAYDRSGVAMCVTDEPREHTAAFLTLGTDEISIPADVTDHVEEGMCSSTSTSTLSEPLHVIASFPHMHERGRKLRSVILRGGESGPEDVLIDEPNFDFDNQTYIPIEPEILIEPGDAVRTTCTYDNEGGAAAQYGTNSEDEMCFNFAVVWPIEIFDDSHVCML